MRVAAAALLLLYICTPRPVGAQGLPFHTQSALTTAFEERGFRVFSMVQRRGDMTASVSPMVLLPWAPHHRVTTMAVLPIVHKRLAGSDPAAGVPYSTTGIGDLALSAKWAFFGRDRFAGTTRLALIVSGSLPTGSTDSTLRGGEVAPRPLQLGKGSASVGATLAATLVRDRWGFNADVGHLRYGSDDGFRFGGVTRYDVALGFRIPRHIETIRTRTLQLYLEWNGSFTERSRQGGADLVDTGGHLAYLSPGAQWVVLPQLLFEGSVQVPVIHDPHGTQIDPGIRPAFGLRFLFF